MDTKALDEILKVAKCTQFPFEMIDQAAAELAELKDLAISWQARWDTCDKERMKLRAELDEARDIIAYSDKCNKTPKAHRGDNGTIRAWSLESEHQFAINAFLQAHPERK